MLTRLSGIPVIVVSARADPSDKISLLLEGAADYVTKPFDTGSFWPGFWSSFEMQKFWGFLQ